MTTLAPVQRLRLLRELERKVLWLSAWTVHHANHLRPNRDGLKVGGHQASSASLATVMTALYFSVLKPEDRVITAGLLRAIPGQKVDPQTQTAAAK